MVRVLGQEFPSSELASTLSIPKHHLDVEVSASDRLRTQCSFPEISNVTLGETDSKIPTLPAKETGRWKKSGREFLSLRLPAHAALRALLASVFSSKRRQGQHPHRTDVTDGNKADRVPAPATTVSTQQSRPRPPPLLFAPSYFTFISGVIFVE